MADNLDFRKEVDRHRVIALAKCGIFLAQMSAEGRSIDGHEDPADLYNEVVMALGIEDSEFLDIALEVARDHPEGNMLLDGIEHSAFPEVRS